MDTYGGNEGEFWMELEHEVDAGANDAFLRATLMGMEGTEAEKAIPSAAMGACELPHYEYDVSAGGVASPAMVNDVAAADMLIATPQAPTPNDVDVAKGISPAATMGANSGEQSSNYIDSLLDMLMPLPEQGLTSPVSSLQSPTPMVSAAADMPQLAKSTLASSTMKERRSSTKKRRSGMSLEEKRRLEEMMFPKQKLMDLSGTTSSESRKMTADERALVLFKRKLRNRESARRSRDNRRKQADLAGHDAPISVGAGDPQIGEIWPLEPSKPRAVSEGTERVKVQVKPFDAGDPALAA